MSDGDRDQQPPEPDAFGLREVRELLHLLSQTDVTELQIERGGARLHIKRGAVAPAFIAPAQAGAALPTPSHPPLPPALTHLYPGGAAPSPQAETDPLPSGQVIAAPMVGTFYSAPSPKEKPYVEEGDVIQQGDRVGIIEAMKMMNEIESEVAGTIVRILVKNGQPVEFGQPLMVVEPAKG